MLDNVFSLKIGEETAGTSLQGFVTCSYFDLVQTFGEPKTGSSDGKYSMQWSLEFSAGLFAKTVRATIYDYEGSDYYRGDSSANLNWHIGGDSGAACFYVLSSLLETLRARAGA